ncbi:MAG: nicotinate-nucleotide adenylyltransferase [Xanthomonadaceae bacterium]|nr:nicotinate-nucleotide adenylyltransferase [Xanthomonadaceae bacterium]
MLICYGGSFDPVHNGHLAVARAARDACAASVLLLPAGDPPHKDNTHADALQRAAMLELAVAGEAGVLVDRRELQRPGPSYTVDTLRELRRELGSAAPVAWLIGSDSLRQLHTWHRWRELFDLAHLLCVQRPGAGVDAAQLRRVAPEVLAELEGRSVPPDTLHAAPAGGFAQLPLPQLREESSTELRRRIAAGEAWQSWLPPAVAAYIVRNGLYRDRAAILPPSSSSDRP